MEDSLQSLASIFSLGNRRAFKLEQQIPTCFQHQSRLCPSPTSATPHQRRPGCRRFRGSATRCQVFQLPTIVSPPRVVHFVDLAHGRTPRTVRWSHWPKNIHLSVKAQGHRAFMQNITGVGTTGGFRLRIPPISTSTPLNLEPPIYRSLPSKMLADAYTVHFQEFQNTRNN
jgi:hypothetical protein